MLIPLPEVALNRVVQPLPKNPRTQDRLHQTRRQLGPDGSNKPAETTDLTLRLSVTVSHNSGRRPPVCGKKLRVANKLHIYENSTQINTTYLQSMKDVLKLLHN